jgi:hypothetical protein
MASLSKTCKVMEFKTDDQYNTTKDIWSSIADYIPKDKILWEAFMLNNTSSQSVEILRNMGHSCIGNHDIDFFLENCGDVIVSNPPYSIKKKIFARLALLDKPFILVLPISTITKQFVKVLQRDKLQMIIPKNRMQFNKAGVELSGCWFDTCFLCYKIGLERDITFL